MSELAYSAILRKLRPPYGQAARVVYGFSVQPQANLGLTLSVPAGAPLAAPGDGVVDLITPAGARWRNDLGTSRMTAVRIDHGKGVKTWVHGLGNLNVGYGPVTRGQCLGSAAQTQIFFGFEQSGRLVDPTRINRYFQIQDGYLLLSEEKSLRPAPDVITRVLSDIGAFLSAGITYLLPPVPTPVRFNLNFNGNGDKSGGAVTGDGADVWQDVSPLDFAGTVGYGICVNGITYPAEQGFFLQDYAGTPTRIYLTRVELTAGAGSDSFFDSMLSSWVGGYTGPTPLLNSFTIRNLPGGTYRLLVYSNGTATNPGAVSTAYCGVDGGAPTAKVLTTSPTAAWVADANYAEFGGLVVSAKGQISLAVYGYLAGLQLERVST